MKLKVGMIQLLVEGGEPERNLERALKYINIAAKDKIDIALLPETLDLAWTHPSAKKEAEPIPGKYSNILSEAAKQHSIYICAGLTEKDGDKIYNTAVMINDKGEIILKYRKINLLWNVEYPEYYSIGQSLSVIDTPWGKIGVNICADNYMDGLHIGHTLARMGAQVILSPSSWTVDYSITEGMDPYKEKWIKPYKILATYHNLVILGSTSVGYIVGGPYEGKKMIGCSLAVDKTGILAQGEFNEFASDVKVVEFEVPVRKEMGTAIGASLLKRGYKFDELLPA
jgi:predicted amidohydrolase